MAELSLMRFLKMWAEEHNKNYDRLWRSVYEKLIQDGYVIDLGRQGRKTTLKGNEVGLKSKYTQNRDYTHVNLNENGQEFMHLLLSGLVREASIPSSDNGIRNEENTSVQESSADISCRTGSSYVSDQSCYYWNNDFCKQTYETCQGFDNCRRYVSAEEREMWPDEWGGAYGNRSYGEGRR